MFFLFVQVPVYQKNFPGKNRGEVNNKTEKIYIDRRQALRMGRALTQFQNLSSH